VCCQRGKAALITCSRTTDSCGTTSGNTAGLKAAAGFLKQAITLTVDKTETESLNNKIQAIESQIKTKSEPAPAVKHP